jgi:hypothetical protein
MKISKHNKTLYKLGYIKQASAYQKASPPSGVRKAFIELFHEPAVNGNWSLVFENAHKIYEIHNKKR